jgi:hypothetical protein
LDGHKFDVKDEEKPVLPLHWSCRCTYIPIPKDPLLKLTEKGPAATKGGEKVEFTTENYNQWLRRQVTEDPEFLKDVLGPARFELFKEGKISLSAMSTHGRIKRLSEL